MRIVVEEVETAATVDGAPRSPPPEPDPPGVEVEGAGDADVEDAGGPPPAVAPPPGGCAARSPVGAIARPSKPSDGVSEPCTIVATADVTAWVGRGPTSPAKAQTAITPTPASAS